MIATMKKAIAAITVTALLGLGFVGSAQATVPVPPALSQFGTVLFNEGFTGNAFEEGGSSFVPAPSPGPSDVDFGTSNAEWTNDTSTDGQYRADVGTMLAVNGEYVVEHKINLAGIDELDIPPPIYRDYLLDMFDNDLSFNKVGIRLMAIPAVASGNFDIRVSDANDPGTPGPGASDSGVALGLSLAFGTTHAITVHNKDNVLNELDLYVNGTLVGTFEDRDPTKIAGLFTVGNISSVPGFATGSTMDDFTIFAETPVPEPGALTLLGLGGFVFWIRRRSSNR